MKYHVKPFIAGNWKMNKIRRSKAFVEAAVSKPPSSGPRWKQVSQLLQLIWQLLLLPQKVQTLKVAVLKTATLKMVLSLVKQAHKFWKKSVPDYVVTGHQNADYFHETDEDINKSKSNFCKCMFPIIRQVKALKLTKLVLLEFRRRSHSLFHDWQLNKLLQLLSLMSQSWASYW